MRLHCHSGRGPVVGPGATRTTRAQRRVGCFDAGENLDDEHSHPPRNPARPAGAYGSGCYETTRYFLRTTIQAEAVTEGSRSSMRTSNRNIPGEEGASPEWTRHEKMLSDFGDPLTPQVRRILLLRTRVNKEGRRNTPERSRIRDSSPSLGHGPVDPPRRRPSACSRSAP